MAGTFSTPTPDTARVPGNDVCESFNESPSRDRGGGTGVVAFFLSLFIGLAGFFAMVWYGKRRPVGAPLSWGEAMLSATAVFAWMFWVYGVVPHQWLTWAGNELSWRPDKILVGPHLPFTGREGLFEYVLPFTVNYENLAHIGAVVVYAVFLGLMIAAWAIWQDRGKAQPLELTSEYGRPLVKQG